MHFELLMTIEKLIPEATEEHKENLAIEPKIALNIIPSILSFDTSSVKTTCRT